MPGRHDLIPSARQRAAIAALIACGAIGAGSQVGIAQAQEDGVVIEGPHGPIRLTVDCGPSGKSEDGMDCRLPTPECPPIQIMPDGTPCVSIPAEAVEKPRKKARERAGEKAEERKDEVETVTGGFDERDERTPARSDRRAARREHRAAVKRERRAQAPVDAPAAAPKEGADALAGEGRTISIPGLAMADIPEPPGFLKPIYKEAGRKHGVPWQVLASINEIETQYGRLLGPSPAGAIGWMQFMPATWKAYGVDADGDGRKDPDNPRDAIFAAAAYLEAAGARENLSRAIYAYNHAQWYVQAVLLRAREMNWRDPKVTKLLRMRRWQLERRVLRDERITIYGCGREDIAEHRIDRRVLLILRFLADSELHPTVSSLECGHSRLTKSGNVSHHFVGAAVDISALNGEPITAGNQGSGSLTEAAVRRLVTLRGIMAPDQIISLLEVEGADNTFSMSDHGDHIHIGFKPRRDVAARWQRLPKARRHGPEAYGAIISRATR